MASESNKNYKTRLENVEAKSNPTVSKAQTNNPPTPKTNSRRSSRGWGNTFQPGEHGLLVRKTADSNRKPKDAIQELHRSLTDRFDPNRVDVVSLLHIEMLITDYWRMSKGLEYEQKSMAEGYAFYQNYMDCMTRYVGAARRNLDKSLQMLRQIEKENEEAAALEAGWETTEARATAADSSPELEPNATRKSDQPEQVASTTSPSAACIQEQPATDGAAAETGAQTSNQQERAPQVQPSTAVPLPPKDHASTQETEPAANSAGEIPAADLPTAA